MAKGRVHYKLPVPQVPVTDWTHWCIEWPNTDEWFSILLGLLDSVGRGRIWDESTGLVTDAANIGKEAFLRNWPVSQCIGDGEVLVKDLLASCAEKELYVQYSDDTSKTLDLSCFSNGASIIQFVDGVLQIFDTSSETWVDLVDIVNVIQENTMDCDALRACLSDLIDETVPGEAEPAQWPDGWGGENPDEACLLAQGARAICAQAADEINTAFTDPLVTVAAIAAILAGVLLIVVTAGAAIALWLSLGAAILGAGAAGFAAAVSEDNLDDFKCIVYNAIVGEGELNNAAIAAAKTEVDSKFSGDALAKLFFNTMLDVAGIEGITNAVLAYGITDDDCSECAESSPIGLVSSTEWPAYQTVIDMGNNRYMVNSDFDSGPCWVAGFESDQGMSGAFYIASTQGDEGDNSGACNSNKMVRLYKTGQSGYTQLGGWDELLGYPDSAWRIHVFSIVPDFTLDFTVTDEAP